MAILEMAVSRPRGMAGISKNRRGLLGCQRGKRAQEGGSQTRGKALAGTPRYGECTESGGSGPAHAGPMRWHPPLAHTVWNLSSSSASSQPDQNRALSVRRKCNSTAGQSGNRVRTPAGSPPPRRPSSQRAKTTDGLSSPLSAPIFASSTPHANRAASDTCNCRR